jgi:CheY-like chemotaxis protein
MARLVPENEFMPYQILVADDDANIRELAALHLRAAGYAVRLAEDGVAAGYAVLESPPDLILCDLHMPRMTGLEFVAALRADTTLPWIPVLFLSSMDEGADHAQTLGAVEYLLKPLRADLLLGAVSRHLPRRPALGDSRS